MERYFQANRIIFIITFIIIIIIIIIVINIIVIIIIIILHHTAVRVEFPYSFLPCVILLISPASGG